MSRHMNVATALPIEPQETEDRIAIEDRIASPTLPARASTRLLSLDAFRGLTVATMVIVNNPGDWDHVYWPLLHAEWHGWSPTDLIFPFFLFIVGVSMTFSRAGKQPWSGVIRRTAMLFGLGLFLSGFPFFGLRTWRIPGVLQRIAVCSLAATVALRATRPAAAARVAQQAVRLAVIAIVLLGGYWCVMMRLQTPWAIAGDLSPDGNLGAALDRAALMGHLYRPRHDPEGILSTVPAVATTITGLLAGLWLHSRIAPGRKAAGLAIAGVVAVALGLAWGRTFPINKELWTSSYSVFTAGAAALALAVCYAVLDVWRLRAWSQPFRILGVNAIAVFVLSGLVGKLLWVIHFKGVTDQPVSLQWLIYNSYFVPLATPINASLLYATAFLIVMFLPMWALYRCNILLKV